MLSLNSDMVELDVVRMIMFFRWIESRILDLGGGMEKVRDWMSLSGNLGLWLLWIIMHFMLSIYYLLLGLVNTMESFLISSGFLKRYNSFDISRVQYLAVVIDSEEALQTLKVRELLQWLASIGVKNVCLYDKQGVLKKSKEALNLGLKSVNMSKENTAEMLLQHKYMNFEIISSSDGKQAVSRAANFLLGKHYLGPSTEKPNLTESDLRNALEAIGYNGRDPDLMLVYGRARCHLGFPAWRIRYTEIVHMGPLRSKKLGALIKAVHRFTKVNQNYGK